MRNGGVANDEIISFTQPYALWNIPLSAIHSDQSWKYLEQKWSKIVEPGNKLSYADSILSFLLYPVNFLSDE